ncbi:MAG: cytochrome c oxidase subunit I [Dehalococcoidia bacterium]
MTANVGQLGHAVAAKPTGLWSWLTTVDHKRIGILYGASAFIFFLIGGIEALLVRVQLFMPGSHVLTPDQYNQLFTMHGTTMVFLAIMPMNAALLNYLVPLMIGARDVAFPRLNAFSFWCFLAGGLLMNLSFLVGGAPDFGWFGYAPLTSKQFSPEIRADFWAMGIQVLGVASLAAAFNFIVTIINMRAPGMTLLRMPPFVWMQFVTQWLLALALPPIAVGLILLTFDRNFSTNFYLSEWGGDPILWQHLFWIFGHPEVYILILPAFGIISEILPTFARKPLFGYTFVVYSGIAIGFLGFIVWAHHMFATGMGPVADSAFAISTTLIAIPTGVKIFNWIGTLWQGQTEYKTPALFAVAFIAMFIIGGLSGVMHASPPADLQQTDSYFIVAHFHYVLFGGSIFGIFGGAYYWLPKVTGRLLNEGLGKVHFWLMLIGFNLTFFPMHFVGLNGMPRRTYTYPAGFGWELMNQMETVGAFIIALSIFVFIINLLRSVRNGEVAGANPWGGGTLEWSIPSPPPVYNFATLPVVRSLYTLWDGPNDSRLTRPAVVTTAAQDEPHIHLPNPSFWPLVTALGLVLIASGLIFGLVFSGVGVLILLAGAYNWALEPAS